MTIAPQRTPPVSIGKTVPAGVRGLSISHTLSGRSMPWIILILVPLAVHWPELSSWLSANPLYFLSGLTTRPLNQVLPGYPGWIDGNAGVTTQALGRLVVRDWSHGIVPWWNPYSGIGLPLAAEMQPSAFFLPFVFLLGLFDGVLYLKITVQILAGLASYALLRELQIGRRASLTAAILFQLNGTFAWFSHAPIMPVAFLPLFLFGIERAWRRAGQHRTGGWPWITIAVAYSIVAGFPETAFIDGLLAFAWSAYRFTMASRQARWIFLSAVIGGGFLGLLLALPAMMPFLEFLRDSDLAGHAIAGSLGFHREHFALLLFPYVYGTIDFGNRDDIWSVFIGGYISLSVLLLGLLGVKGRRMRGLRYLLATWIVLSIAKASNAPGIAFLFNLVPFVREAEFFRYAQPSWEMALVILVAFGLDDWHRGNTRGITRPVLAFVCCAILGGLALFAGRSVISSLWSVPGYRPYFWASLVAPGLISIGLISLYAGGVSRGRSAFLCSLLIADAVVLFSVPLLSGAVPQPLDIAAVRFLRQNIGLSRYYTLGPLAPNYGAYFGIASINHNYLPVPQNWVRYIKAKLDPGADSATFNGTFPPPSPTGSRPRALRRHLANYAELGVKYVVVPHGNDPFAESVSVPTATSGAVAYGLVPGDGLSGDIPPDFVRPGEITAFAVTIGNYLGRATGRLDVTVCSPAACSRGGAELAESVDGAPLKIALSPALEVHAGDRVRYRIMHEGGHTPVAIWRWPAISQPRDSNGTHDMPVTHLPHASLIYRRKAASPYRVYESNALDIFQIRGAAPYFQTIGADCGIRVTDRQFVRVDCPSTAVLMRRELFFPGWQAKLNDKVVQIAPADTIFQSVAVPAGVSEIRFSYVPPHLSYAIFGFMLGCVGFLVGVGRDLRARRRV